MKADDYVKPYHADRRIEKSIDDCVEIIRQLSGIYYPPSGKYYEFKDGTACEDWDLESTIRRKLVEINHIKRGGKE